GCSATATAVHARMFAVVVLPGKRRFGAMLAAYPILLWGEPGPPLGIRAGDLFAVVFRHL
ncbi:MAG: hypothetical protein QF485_10290, partial [Arenicellales bacterium]|nr:hypothetical protein [Arenicellales bacterium]